MELYKYNSNLKSVLQGPIELKGAIAELKAIASKGGDVFDDETKAIPETSFTLSRSDSDWLEIATHSEGEIYFSSDRKIFDLSWFKKLFASPSLQFQSSVEQAHYVISDYYSLSRAEFESKYSIGYTSKDSLYYAKI